MLCRRCIYKKKKKKNCPHSSIILIHQDGFLREFLLNESRYSYLVFRFPEKVWPKLAFPCYDEVKINVDMIGRWKSKYIQSFLVIMGNTLMLQEMLVSGTILWFLYLLVFFVLCWNAKCLLQIWSKSLYIIHAHMCHVHLWIYLCVKCPTYMHINPFSSSCFLLILLRKTIIFVFFHFFSF